MTTSVEQSVTEGFLRPADAALILENAFANDIGPLTPEICAFSYI